MKDFTCRPPVPPCGEPCAPDLPQMCPPPKPPQPCPTNVPSVVEGSSWYQVVNDLSNRVNTMCSVYNDVMSNCYATLHNLQRAAEENGAYYGPCEVWTENGYWADESAAYTLVHKAVVDRRGDPIFIELHLAYGNTTNSQVAQGLFNASKVTYADKITLAQPIREGHGWYGNAIWHGAPIPSETEATLYTMGFTRSGVMRVYSNSVTTDQMLRDTIENAMGVPGILIQNGQVTDPSFRANIPMADQQTQRVCIGQNLETREVIFLTCGNENDVNRNGLTSEACAQILLQQGCDIAVELTEYSSAEMMDKGSLMFEPEGNNIPEGQVFWYISRKRFYTTDYERELALLMQNYGKCIWETHLNHGRIKTLSAELKEEISNREKADAVLQEQILTEVDARVKADEVLQGQILAEVENRGNADNELQKQILAEVSNRVDADSVLQAQITAEEAARLAADAELQKQVLAEVENRTNADTLLQDQILTEVDARKSADTVLQTQIDNEVQARTEADTELQRQILNEVQNRTDGDAVLQDQITTEQGARIAADNVLQTNINNEADARTKADQEEAAARQAADLQLQANIDKEVQDRINAVAEETADRQSQDNLLQANIDKETQDRIAAITEEVTARKAADTALDTKWTQALNDISQRLTEAESDIITVQSLYNTLQRQTAAMDEAITALQVTITAIETAMNNVKQSIEDIRNGTIELPYLPLTGGTLTGNLLIRSGEGGTTLPIFKAGDKSGNGLCVYTQGASIKIATNSPMGDPLTIEAASVRLSMPGPGELNLNNRQIANVATPTRPKDAANKAYVDAAIPAGIQPATDTTLGGIIVGDNLEITAEGRLSANAGGYTLPAATADTLGGIKVGENLTVTADGTLSAQSGGVTEAEADAKYLQLTGGNLTGPLSVIGGINTTTVASNTAGITLSGTTGATTTKISGTTVKLSSATDNDIPVKLTNLANPTTATDAATKTYVDSAVANADTYELPTATASRLGGVKVGQNLTVADDGTLSAIQGTYTLPPASSGTLGGVKVGQNLTVTSDGTLSAIQGTYTLPTATTTTLGGVIVGNNLTVDGSGKLNATQPPAYTLPAATTSTLGGLIVGDNLTVDGNGRVSAAQSPTYTLPAATASTLGGVKIGANVTASADGTISVADPGLPTTNPAQTQMTVGWGTAASGALQIKRTDASPRLSLFADAEGAYITSTGPSAVTDLHLNAKSIALLSGTKITGVGTPASANDAANKAYVDSAVSGAGGGGVLADSTITSGIIASSSNGTLYTTASSSFPTVVTMIPGMLFITGKFQFNADINTTDITILLDSVRTIAGEQLNFLTQLNIPCGTVTILNNNDQLLLTTNISNTHWDNTSKQLEFKFALQPGAVPTWRNATVNICLPTHK